jgi:hypothetical protein
VRGGTSELGPRLPVVPPLLPLPPPPVPRRLARAKLGGSVDFLPPAGLRPGPRRPPPPGGGRRGAFASVRRSRTQLCWDFGAGRAVVQRPRGERRSRSGGGGERALVRMPRARRVWTSGWKTGRTALPQAGGGLGGFSDPSRLVAASPSPGTEGAGWTPPGSMSVGGRGGGVSGGRGRGWGGGRAGGVRDLAGPSGAVQCLPRLHPRGPPSSSVHFALADLLGVVVVPCPCWLVLLRSFFGQNVHPLVPWDPRVPPDPVEPEVVEDPYVLVVPPRPPGQRL